MKMTNERNPPTRQQSNIQKKMVANSFAFYADTCPFKHLLCKRVLTRTSFQFRKAWRASHTDRLSLPHESEGRGSSASFLLSVSSSEGLVLAHQLPYLVGCHAFGPSSGIHDSYNLQNFTWLSFREGWLQRATLSGAPSK